MRDLTADLAELHRRPVERGLPAGQPQVAHRLGVAVLAGDLHLFHRVGQLHQALRGEAERATHPRVWADFAHVLMNVKEFIFLN